jgi:N-methylhydantoinase A
VVTGYLNPDYLLGGKLKIYKKLAEMSFKGVAKKLKLDIIDAAYGAIRVANDNSSNLIRLISIRKGFDPREFTLIAHGGSGPMIAPFIAEELSFSKVVVPTIPSGVFNAWGMIGLDIRHELVQTNVILIEKSEKFLKAINPIFRKLEDKINNVFEKEEIGSKKIEIQRFLDMQYEGQAHTLKVQCPDGKLDVKKIEKIIKTFHDVHFREYGFNLYNSGIEIVNFHLAGLHKVEHPKIKKDTNHNLLENVLIGERKVYNGHKKIIMNVYKKESLPTNILIDFPCIIEDKTSTIIVTENFKAHRDEYGNLIILKK